MNKELLYAAHQLHGMIKIKDEELIDPRGSYPRIKLNPGAAFVCFADRHSRSDSHRSSLPDNPSKAVAKSLPTV